MRVQVLPSALPKPLREQGFSASQEAGLLWEGSDVLCEFRLGQGEWEDRWMSTARPIYNFTIFRSGYVGG
ncbi:MAG TPA: hypothetical protein VFS66_07230 [Acidimicrobiia bacterium]|nr:hypothetical protein [Acidimicrobiia bacterium]